MAMNLYEVIFSGPEGASQCQNNEDTIYLVRASDFRAAVAEVVNNAAPSNHQGRRFSIPHVVFEIGIDATNGVNSGVADSQILRGPYYQHAYNHGWKAWRRRIDGADYGTEWEGVGS